MSRPDKRQAYPLPGGLRRRFMEIRFGTSGYSYKDWAGSVYPPHLPQQDWLSYYARLFPTTELNFSFYRLPEARTLEKMVAKVPADFLFAVKAFQGLTHELELTYLPDFVAGLQPLIERGQLGAVLLQFPYRFHNTPTNRELLQRLRDGMAALPLAVEFRVKDWLTEATLELLRSLEIAYVCVDMPALPGNLPPEVYSTASLGYVRLHGRNAKTWWKHEESWQRYDYAYSEAELDEWVPKLRFLAEHSTRVLVYANNHWQGQAVNTARQLWRRFAQATGRLPLPEEG